MINSQEKAGQINNQSEARQIIMNQAKTEQVIINQGNNTDNHEPRRRTIGGRKKTA